MRFSAGRLPGLCIVDVERLEDERGFFARTWCAGEFREHGLPDAFCQASISYNRVAGTVRGMHFQKPPSREGKLIRCVQGAIHDVVVDLRPDSPAFLRHEAFELSAVNRRSIFVPPGFAHGFQTLTDEAEVQYQMTDAFAPELGGGFRWDDPTLGIHWPLTPTVMSARDRSYPDLDPVACDVFRTG
ncbi:MAG: dTDP-4-dehydrorhamnose 3,5-epimerase [Gammaproteobacteria bacterium]|jgi:dTDP-4-dehydrorhamnose 3,5-epimerase|nr:dTDP-4-dehydrorhamnose 3,5-epimerase [Gammaproteobacteria bacterium]